MDHRTISANRGGGPGPGLDAVADEAEQAVGVVDVQPVAAGEFVEMHAAVQDGCLLEHHGRIADVP